MSLAYKTAESSAAAMDVFLNRLETEWRNPQEGNVEPIIIEESPSRQARTNHLYVVWSEWTNLSPLERSKIVMQAYSKVKGPDMANDITVAMGLTPAEADKMRLDYLAA
jgi:hypothetical protein